MKLNKKGFTIVELVIVIAVIAILAAVLIPTFSSIIDKANESADIQAVRQMNVALAAESVYEAPEGIADVVTILANNGFNAVQKLIPVSTGHGFYWYETKNIILLIKDEGEGATALVFPTDDPAITNITLPNTKDSLAAVNGFYDLETAGRDAELPEGNTGGAGGGSGGNTSVTTVNTPADLKKALEAGGTVKLEASIELADPVTISDGVIVTLDLNRYTLTLADQNPTDEELVATGDPFSYDYDDVITVSGTLNIVDNSDAGTGEIVIEPANGFYSDNISDGIYVTQSGTLDFDGISISGNRITSINNHGTAFLTNTNWTLDGTDTYEAAYGLVNHGTATITVEGDDGSSTFTSNDVAQPVCNNDGTINIDNTKFIEGTSFTGYSSHSPVNIDDGMANLTSLDFSESTKSVYAGAAARVTISDCTIPVDAKLGLSSSDDSVYIFKDFAGLEDSEAIDAIRSLADAPDQWTIVKTVVNNVTTYTAGVRLTPNALRDTLTYDADTDTLTINDGDTVTMYLAPNGFRIISPVVVEGTLKFVKGKDVEKAQLYGDIYDTNNKIILQPDGTLDIDVDVTYQYDNNGSHGGMSREVFFKDHITATDGYTTQTTDKEDAAGNVISYTFTATPIPTT